MAWTTPPTPQDVAAACHDAADTLVSDGQTTADAARNAAGQGADAAQQAGEAGADAVAGAIQGAQAAMNRFADRARREAATAPARYDAARRDFGAFEKRFAADGRITSGERDQLGRGKDRFLHPFGSATAPDPPSPPPEVVPLLVQAILLLTARAGAAPTAAASQLAHQVLVFLAVALSAGGGGRRTAMPLGALQSLLQSLLHGIARGLPRGVAAVRALERVRWQLLAASGSALRQSAAAMESGGPSGAEPLEGSYHALIQAIRRLAGRRRKPGGG
jgi:hypothetical protein